MTATAEPWGLEFWVLGFELAVNAERRMARETREKTRKGRDFLILGDIAHLYLSPLTVRRSAFGGHLVRVNHQILTADRAIGPGEMGISIQGTSAFDNWIIHLFVATIK